MDFIVYFGLCVFAVIIFAYYIRCVIKQYKQSENKKGMLGEETKKIKTEFTTVKVKAEVIDLCCRTDMIGIKTPKAIEIYTVFFETDGKETICINVPKEMYEGLEKGQRGELTLVEGELYSFII